MAIRQGRLEQDFLIVQTRVVTFPTCTVGSVLETTVKVTRSRPTRSLDSRTAAGNEGVGDGVGLLLGAAGDTTAAGSALPLRRQSNASIAEARS